MGDETPVTSLVLPVILRPILTKVSSVNISSSGTRSRVVFTNNISIRVSYCESIMNSYFLNKEWIDSDKAFERNCRESCLALFFVLFDKGPLIMNNRIVTH